jgi:hypothetical protein
MKGLNPEEHRVLEYLARHDLYDLLDIEICDEMMPTVYRLFARDLVRVEKDNYMDLWEPTEMGDLMLLIYKNIDI